MKKLKLILIVSTIICTIISIIFVYERYQQEQLLTAIDSNFHIRFGKYHIESNEEVNIFNNGECIFKNDFSSENSETKQIPVDELHKFLTYAVEKGFFDLKSDYSSEEIIYDPVATSLEITIGERKHMVTYTATDNEIINGIESELDRILAKLSIFLYYQITY